MEKEKESRSLRNQLLQLIPSGVGVYDVTGNTVKKEYLNDGYYQMMGARREERHQYDGTETVNAILPEDMPALLAEVRAAIREKRPLHSRFRILDGGGVYRWVAIQANHVPIAPETERFYAAYYDIDELMRTQEQLRDNERTLNDLLTYSEILHFTYLPRQHRYEAHVLPQKLRELPAFLDDFPESLIRYAGLNGADAAAYREMIRRIDAGEQEAECTIHFRYLGKYTWYRVRLLNFLDGDGTPLKAIGNAINVDAYMEAEKAFREEKLRMKSMQSGILAASCFNVTRDFSMDLNDDANVCYLEPKGRESYQEAIAADPEIARQNPGTLRVLLSAAEQIPDPEQRRRFLCLSSHAGMMRLYAAGQRETTLEYRRWTGRGLIWVSTRIVLLPDPETGDVLAFFYTSDANDRIIYQKITNQIFTRKYEAVSYYDLHTGELFLKAGPGEGAIAFRPAPYAEAVERAITQYVLPEEAAQTREKFRMPNVLAALEQEDSYSIYYTGVQLDETLPGRPHKRMKSDFFYLDADRDVVIILQSNATEIYEQERATREQMAAALQAAERANRAKTEFVSRISHDIRTPISIISSMTDFALADMDSPDKLENDLEKIRTANTFLLSLINDVLDISKIDSGKITLNPEPYPFEEYSANLRNMLAPMCEEKGLRYVISGQRNRGVIVADKIRLNQITLNLLSNAVKYTPAGGTVSYISESEDLPDGRVRYGFCIRDTGIGMSERFQKTMFEPFTQEYDNPERPRGMSGTGLGLAIVKKMVDLMGGALTVKSEPGKGTEIHCSIVFPDALRDSRYRGGADAARPDGADTGLLSGKVLLAEDNPINTEIAVRILHSFGLETDCAENGALAVERFAASAPGTYSAVLMDIQMPVLNGYEATRRIRALPRPDSGAIPIFAMTADAFADAARRGQEAGMDAYIVKPLDPALLRRTLARVCGRQAGDENTQA